MIRKAATPMASAVQARAAVDLNDLPWAHRLGYWIDQVCAASAEADCELASDPNQLHGRLSHLRVGDIAINHLRVSAQTFRRTRAHLSHAREDVFALVRVCSGSAQVEQGEFHLVPDRSLHLLRRQRSHSVFLLFLRERLA